MPASESLQNASEQLSQAVGEFETEAAGSFAALNQRFEQVIAREGETTDAQQAVATRLQEVMQEIENVRTQELSARMILESGVVEGVEMPDANAEQIRTFADQIEAYVTSVSEVQNEFVQGQLSKVEAEQQLQTELNQTTRKLEQQGEMLGLQSDQVGALKENFELLAQGMSEDMQAQESMGIIGGAEQFAMANEAYEQFKGRATSALQSVQFGEGAMEASLTAALRNPWILGGALLASGISAIVDRFLELDEAAQTFLDETGFGAERAAQVRRNVAQLAPELRRAGLESEDLVESQVALTEQFGSFQNAAQQLDSSFAGIQDPAQALRTEITQVAGRLRISGQEAAELITEFESVAASTGMSRQNLQSSAMAAAQAAEVAPKQVMQDIAENSEQLAKFSGMSGERLASAAAQAQNLGTNIGQVAELNEQILTDIPGFVQGLEKARTLAPQIGLDPQQLTRAAAQGPDALTAELEEQFQGVDMGNLDFFTKQRLSDAFGMSVQQLTKISERAREADASMGQITEQVREGDASMAQMFDAEDAQTALTELQNELSALLGMIGQAFVPVFEAVASGLNTFVSAINDGMQALREFSKPLSNAVGMLMGGVGLVAAFKGTAAAISATGLSSLLPSLGLSFSGIGAAAGTAAAGLSSVVGPFIAVGAAIAYFREPLMDVVMGLGSGLMTVIGPLSSQFDRLLEALEPVTTLFSDMFGAIAAGSGSASWVQPTFETIGMVLGDVLVAGVKTAVGAIDIGIQSIRTLGNAFGFLFDLITLDFSGAMENLGQTLGGLTDIVSTFVETSMSIGADFVATFMDGVSANELENALVQMLTRPLDSFGNTLKNFFTSIPQKIGVWLSGASQAIVNSLTPSSTQGLSQAMSSVAGTVSSYLPSSPAETGPLSDLDKVDITGEISRSIQPEPVKQQMETTMGEATQAATDSVQPQQIEQANQVQVDGGGSAAQPDQSQQIPDGIIPLLRKIANNEQQILNAIQNQELDAYMDSKKVTDNLRKNNNKNLMRM